MKCDVIIAGAGPAGLSAAYAAASRGASVLIIEQNNEIGSPTRTSGGSFIRELLALDIPERLLHPIRRIRFLSPNSAATFRYDEPVMCVMDVRGVYQHLAAMAAGAGAQFWLGSKALDVLRQGDRIAGIRVQTRTKSVADVGATVTIDATGYKGHLLRQAGVGERIQRYGVGAEFDMLAPNCDESEAVLVVGSRFAPSGYGWIFPWGRHRVRVGVGVIHPDHSSDPAPLLDSFLEHATEMGVNLAGAQPIEYHFGLIPSEMSEVFAGEGIVGVGDAAGHASTLVGEGIRWAIEAGRMAGRTAADAARTGDASAAALTKFQTEWLGKYGRNLRIANVVNRKIAKWNDARWDAGTELLAHLSPQEFATALKTDFSLGWALGVAWAHPRLFKTGFGEILARVSGA